VKYHIDEACPECGEVRRDHVLGICVTCLSQIEKKHRRDRQRQINARKGGYMPPPPEGKCPPRPKDKICQLCGRITKDRPRGPSRRTGTEPWQSFPNWQGDQRWSLKCSSGTTPTWKLRWGGDKILCMIDDLIAEGKVERLGPRLFGPKKTAQVFH
jgi:hypothetical protein